MTTLNRVPKKHCMKFLLSILPKSEPSISNVSPVWCHPHLPTKLNNQSLSLWMKLTLNKHSIHFKKTTQLSCQEKTTIKENSKSSDLKNCSQKMSRSNSKNFIQTIGRCPTNPKAQKSEKPSRLSRYLKWQRIDFMLSCLIRSSGKNRKKEKSSRPETQLTLCLM